MKETYTFTREENGWTVEMPHPKNADTMHTLVFQDVEDADSTAYLLQVESLHRAIQKAFNYWAFSRQRGGIEVLAHEKGSASMQECTVFAQGKPIC